MGKYLVRIGDLDGMGKVYSIFGGLITRSDETMLRQAPNCDMEVATTWRAFLPGIIFSMLPGGSESVLYVTTRRVVLIRKIDVFKSIKGDLTPFGLPKAFEKERRLKQLQIEGAREYCALWPEDFSVVRSKVDKRWMRLFLRGRDNLKYSVIFWNPAKNDHETIPLIKSLFEKPGHAISFGASP